jgi:hypothetical protein
MKYIRKFNEHERSIEDWCKELKIVNYEIDNGLVNVNTNIDIVAFGDRLGKIPIQFGVVNGDFMWRHKLVSLEGSPRNVRGDFRCRDTLITNLEGGPIEVGGRFICCYNMLTSLEGSPKIISSSFDCSNNQIVTLKGSPEYIGTWFNCSHNQLTSLIGAPKIIGDTFDCSHNNLTSLIDGPKEVYDSYNCINNNLKTLEGSPKRLYNFLFCDSNPIFKVYRLFGRYEKYQASLDFEYWNGEDIVRYKFEEACEEAGVIMPDYIPGYKYI